MGSIDHKHQKTHVAVLAFPFGTHAAPLYTLARLLAAAAPDASFSFIGSAKSNAPLSRIPAPVNLRQYEVWDGAPDGFVSRNPQEEVSLFLKVTPGNFHEVMGQLDGGKVTCVLSDCFLWFAGKMADEIGVPWVTLWTGGTCSLSSHIYTDEIRQKTGIIDEGTDSNNGNELLDFVPGLSVMRASDLPEGIVFGDIESPFSCLLHRMGKELSNAVAVALNTFEGLEPDVLSDLTGKLKRCLPIGPLNLLPNPTSKAATTTNFQDPSNCLPWLDCQLPCSVAYIGFGTVISLPPNELVTLAEALEESKVPFLWSLKENQQALLPPGFLDRTRDRGMVVSWAPQMQVLSHASACVFLTHCGWNSVTESVIGGVPMMCRPFFGDQRMNARTVSEMWKIGTVVANGSLTKDWVVSSLNAILRTEEGKRMRDRVIPMKENALKAVDSGGSSVKNFEILLDLVCAT